MFTFDRAEEASIDRRTRGSAAGHQIKEEPMFGFARNPGRTGLRAALLAGATVAALGLGGLNAGSAAAAVCPETENIAGEGATLQKVAQEKWLVGFEKLCTGVHVLFEATGSGAGLHAWGFDDGKTFEKVKDQFVASDDAPTAAQIENAKAAVKEVAKVESKIAVVPVTQTAIAIVAHPPAGCTLTQISNANLEAAFRGTAKTWTAIGAEPAEKCGGSIVRVVREEGSGTTYQFKHYLSTINGEVLPCLAESLNTWTKLQENNKAATPNPNITWPESCTGTELTKVERGKGGKGVAELVASMEGSIGYAALADAENGTEEGKKATILKVENGEKEGKKTFAPPATAEKNANCATATYVLPAGWKTGLDQDWSNTYGANKKIGGATYPICALTFDIGLEKEEAVFGHKLWLTVEMYFLHLINGGKEGGQEELHGSWYAGLPTGAESVTTAAEKAVEAIK
jgi:ABC-type phosphate transport system substrate-binding protein